VVSSHGGLTKREYFAAMAMQGMLTTVSTASLKYCLESVYPIVAVKYADLLIKELNDGESK